MPAPVLSTDPALQRLVDQVLDAVSRKAELNICGGNTKLSYGGLAQGETLDTRDLRGISSYEPTELVITARSGTPLADVEATLTQHGQCLPFEPPRFAPGGTVGGMVAAGLSGPARMSAGALRDYVLGTTIINGRGEVLTFGGQVMKNVAGYDVSRLMAGAWGILGVLCEVSLKVLPVPPATATMRLTCTEHEAQQRLGNFASASLPVNASCWHEGQLTLRLSGARAAVNRGCNLIGGEALPESTAAGWWQSIRDHTHSFFAMEQDHLISGKALWRLSLPATAPPMNLSGPLLIEWAGAQRWCRTALPASKIRSMAASVGGHATLVRAMDKSAGVFSPLSDETMRIHRALKVAFDPAGIFNRGRLYPEF